MSTLWAGLQSAGLLAVFGCDCFSSGATSWTLRICLSVCSFLCPTLMGVSFLGFARERQACSQHVCGRVWIVIVARLWLLPALLRISRSVWSLCSATFTQHARFRFSASLSNPAVDRFVGGARLWTLLASVCCSVEASTRRRWDENVGHLCTIGKLCARLQESFAE